MMLNFKKTLEIVKKESEQYNFQIHYALKANNEEKILSIIKSFGFGADCVSGNEVKRANELGFKNIVFAGVGKSDQEIETYVKRHLLL